MEEDGFPYCADSGAVFLKKLHMSLISTTLRGVPTEVDKWIIVEAKDDSCTFFSCPIYSMQITGTVLATSGLKELWRFRSIRERAVEI